MSAQATMGDWGPTEHVPGEGLDDDPTPRGVARATLTAAIELYCDDEHADEPGGRGGFRMLSIGGHIIREWFIAEAHEIEPVRVCGIGSGYGCWESEIRKLAQEQGWPVHITGVEINQDREEHGRKWCDEWITRDWFDALRGQPELPTWDLIIGNPPFGELLSDAPKDYYDEFADLLDGDDWPLGMPGWLLEHAPAVLLLHTQQAFLRSEAGRACWRRHPPAASWLVPGSVKFRGSKNGADLRCYQVTLWLRGHSGPCAVHLLDDLTAKERAWSVIPGSESPDVARALGLPMVVGSEHG